MGDSVGPDDREAPKLRIVSNNDGSEAGGIEALVRSAGRKPVISDVFTSIGQCVALRRTEKGISQREFAFALGVKPSLLQKYENGEAVFTPDLLLRAAQILGNQPGDFFVILAKKRLAELSSQVLPIDADCSIEDDSDKIRRALFDTLNKCDSLITVLDIIKASPKS